MYGSDIAGKFLNRIAAVQVFGELMMDFCIKAVCRGLILGKSGSLPGTGGRETAAS